MHLVMVSDGSKHPREASLEVSWKLDIRKPVKTPPLLLISSWSLGSHGSFLTYMVMVSEKLPWKFHEDWTSGSRSRLHLSSKYLHGVFEDTEFSDAPGDGLRWKRTSKRGFPESFMKIEHQKPCQDSTCPPSLFLESWRTWRFLMNLEVVSDDRDHPSEAYLKVSSWSNIRNLVNKTCIFVVKSVTHKHTNTHTPTII